MKTKSFTKAFIFAFAILTMIASISLMYPKNRVNAALDSSNVTNLAGTTWRFRDEWEDEDVVDGTYEVNFIDENSNQHNSLRITSLIIYYDDSRVGCFGYYTNDGGGGSNDKIGLLACGNFLKLGAPISNTLQALTGMSSWEADYYQTITFIDGDAIENTNLIAFMQANADLIDDGSGSGQSGATNTGVVENVIMPSLIILSLSLVCIYVVINSKNKKRY